MIQGRVSEGLQPLATIDLLDADGNPVPTTVLVDTGFDSYLTLPPSLIQQLQLEEYAEVAAEMADGRTIIAPAYLGVAVWEDEERPLVVLEGAETPLGGMKLWQGHRITIEAWPQGLVQVEGTTE